MYQVYTIATSYTFILIIVLRFLLDLTRVTKEYATVFITACHIYFRVNRHRLLGL